MAFSLALGNGVAAVLPSLAFGAVDATGWVAGRL